MSSGGNKRSAQGNAAATSPFKRLKAKVGKRAPKPANYTDVSFKAASIRVSSQEQGLSTASSSTTTLKDGILASGKGRLVSELLSQIGHPATAVRLSAAKGVADIITRHRRHPKHRALLVANLSSLLSAIGKTAVDEEEEIREVGRSAFTSLVETVDASFWRPFLPLVVAFFKSALNTLDAGTCQDGVAFIHILAKHIPLSSAMTAPMIPALVRIWDYKCFQTKGAVSKKAKGNKKKNSSSSKKADAAIASDGKNGKYPLLECLLVLLQSTSLEETGSAGERAPSSSAVTMEPSLVYIPGGTSKNSLVILPTNPPKRPTVTPLHSVRNLVSFSGNASTRNSTNQSSTVHASISLETATLLFTKFRDTIMELQQKECLETYILLAKVMDQFWTIYQDLLVQEIRAASPSKVASLQGMCQQVRSLLLEDFPIINTTSPNATNALKDSLNGQLCLTLVHLAYFMETHLVIETNKKQSKRSNNWLKPVVEYICNKLKEKGLRRPGNESSQETIIRVLQTLLESHETVVQSVPGLQDQLIKAFASFFLPDESSHVPKHIARSPAGEVCVDVIITLFARVDNDLDRAHDVYGSFSLSLFQSLPDFLVAWEEKRVESSYKLATLLSILLRKQKDDDDHTVDAIADRIKEVIEVVRVKLEGMVNNTDLVKIRGKAAEHCSVLEALPSGLQRLIISLFIVLGAPTSSTLTWMSHLCARSFAGNPTESEPKLSADVSAFLVQSIFSIRTSIKMGHFLSFLIDSTGVSLLEMETKHGEGFSVSEKWLNQFDHGASICARCLVYCGVERVVAKLAPLLESFLAENSNAIESGKAMQSLAQARLAMLLLSAFAVDMKERDSIDTMTDLMSDSLKNAAIQSCIHTLQSTPVDHIPLTESLIQPYVGFFFLESSMLVTLFVSCIAKIESADSEEESQTTNLLQWLLLYIRAPTWPSALLGSEGMETIKSALEKLQVTESGRLRELKAQLLVELEIAEVK